MASSMHNDVLDGALDIIATGTRVIVCTVEPASYAAAVSTALATATVTAGDGNGDWTITDGDNGGRTLTMAAQAAVTIDATDTAQHIAITDGVSVLLAVTTLTTSQLLTAGGGNTVSIPAFTFTNSDPS